MAKSRLGRLREYVGGLLTGALKGLGQALVAIGERLTGLGRQLVQPVPVPPPAEVTPPTVLPPAPVSPVPTPTPTPPVSPVTPVAPPTFELPRIPTPTQTATPPDILAHTYPPITPGFGLIPPGGQVKGAIRYLVELPFVSVDLQYSSVFRMAVWADKPLSVAELLDRVTDRIWMIYYAYQRKFASRDISDLQFGDLIVAQAIRFKRE